MQTYQRLPLSIKKGKGSWVWDIAGIKYLDAVAGIASCSLGHSNRKLRKALTSQLQIIQHVSNLYHIPEQESLAKWLVKNSAADKAFFCNSGAEANEAAIKLARKYGHIRKKTENPIILSANLSFHGRTLAAVSATGQAKYHKGFEPLVQGFHFFEYNNWKSFSDLFETVNKNTHKVSAVLIEPIQGEGGIRMGNKEFFQLLRKKCTQEDVLLIFDEVQTGMGRTGNLWGYEYLGTEPDAFTIAKGLGGGHAIGGLLVKESVDLFEPGDHASTFGGNPFACKAGLTVGQEIQRRNLLDNVRERGSQLKTGLNEILQTHSSHFQEHRGCGLIQGLVIKEDVGLSAQMIVQSALEKKLLIVAAGEKVIRLVPALTISKSEVKELLKRLNSAIYTHLSNSLS